jgi:hypothetical protein
MPVPVAFSPNSLNFGAIAAGARLNGTVTIGSAPSSADVAVSIVDDDSGGMFKIGTVRIFDVVRSHGRIVDLTLVSQSDGSALMPIDREQLLTIRVDFTCPDPAPQDAFFAKLLISGRSPIAGASWNLVNVPMSILAGQLSAIPLRSSITLAQGEQGDLPISLSSVTGPGTTVDFELFPRAGISMAPAGVAVARGQTVTVQLHFAAAQDAPLGSQQLSIFVKAFNSQQSDLLQPAPMLTVVQGKPLIDGSIRWKQANPSAILIEAGEKDAWNAGRVLDVLPLSNGAILVGSDGGGVWSVANTGAALPLSNDWDDPDVNCLERGPNGINHFYAGCGLKGTLFESDPSTAFFGFIDLHSVPIVNSARNAFNTGSIYRIAVLKDTRRIVLACQNGVFWATIPDAGANYTFQQVSTLPVGAYSGVAAGPNNSVAVAALGDGSTRFGIFIGDWSSGNLVMRAATISPQGFAPKMAWTSLASGESDRSVMYGATSDSNGVLLAVLRSTSTGAQGAGQSWSPCNVTVEGAPPGKNILNSTGDSTFGGVRKTVRVSPSDSKMVSLGWGRPFISINSGDSWLPIGMVAGTTDWIRTPEAGKHFHEDTHAVVFDSDDNRQLYVVSDGGVGMTPDLGKTCFSHYNSALLNLEFSGQPAHPGTSYGAFGISPNVAGLVGGGLQDNGNVFCLVGPNATPWRSFGGGDGQVMVFIAPGHLISYDTNNNNVSSSQWDGTKFVNKSVIPVRESRSGAPLPNGLTLPVIEVVSTPHFRDKKSDKLMFAVGCTLGANDVFGLFGDDDGLNLHWNFIGTVPNDGSTPQIWALGSLNGHTVFVGTKNGRIFALTPGSQSTLELSVAPRATTAGAVVRFAIVHDLLAFAVYDTSTTGFILQLEGFGWNALGSGQANVAQGRGLPTAEGGYYALEVDRAANPPSLFVATDNNVYISRNSGETWQLATLGLPKRPHCADLRFATQPDGVNFLYLTTFGRSLWRARLSP